MITPLVPREMMSEERQCRNSILTMCQLYPDLVCMGSEVSSIPQASFCRVSAGRIAKCWLFSPDIAPNDGGMKLLKFVLRNNEALWPHLAS